jgi:hypothetical protein
MVLIGLQWRTVLVLHHLLGPIDTVRGQTAVRRYPSRLLESATERCGMNSKRPSEFSEGRRFGMVCFQQLKCTLQSPTRQPTLNVGTLARRREI